MTTLVLIAKETVPGRVKTRLHPPLTLEEAARLAAASIADTLAAVAALPATRRILLFDGVRTPSGSEHYDVTTQVPGTLDERLAALFDAVTGPTVLIGMDTPQLTAHDLAPAFDGGTGPAGWTAPVDAWFGPAHDGGFWALGLREPDGALVRGVPMSRDDTGARQLERLERAGLRVGTLRTLTDVDTIEDAREVASIAPHGSFARLFESLAVPVGTETR
jgi:glycosyltransferase A (GT-A) superfamily protein (DUF2064 family)